MTDLTDEQVDTELENPVTCSGVAIMDNLPAEQYQQLSKWLEEHGDDE